MFDLNFNCRRSHRWGLSFLERTKNLHNKRKICCPRQDENMEEEQEGALADSQMATGAGYVGVGGTMATHAETGL